MTTQQICLIVAMIFLIWILYKYSENPFDGI